MRFFSILMILLFLSPNSIPEKYFEFVEAEAKDSSKNALPIFMRQSPIWALELLEQMSLEEKIAQSFMVEVTPNKGEEHLKIVDSLVTVHNIGGIIMFQGDTSTTKSTIQRMQNQSKLPLLVGIDGEWGSNMRLVDGERFPFQLTLGAANNLEITKKIAQAMGQEMKELGIHINFSPVVDINTNPNNPVIGFRSFGENPMVVTKNSLEMIKGMHEYGILTSMKHFPGHGDTDIDSHLDLPIVTKSKEELRRIDWLPYRQGRLIGASSIMVGHISVPSLDESGLPASISPKIIQEILREELKFEGLIISDALNMKALTKQYGDVEIVKRAYIAGNDILLYPSMIKESIEAIKLAVESGEITEEEVNAKALRVLRAKYFVQDIEGTIQHPVLTKEQIEYAKIQVYEKALTVVQNKDDVLPIHDASGKSLVINVGGNGDAFVEAIRFYVEPEIYSSKSATDVLKKYKSAFKDYKHIFINLIAPSVLPKNHFSYPIGWAELLENIPSDPNVYVSVFGNPYGLKEGLNATSLDALILAYQNSNIGQNRAAQLIFGGFQSTGKLPVTLGLKLQEGKGIETNAPIRLKFTVPIELGLTKADFYKIDSIVNNGIKEKAFPGAQVVIAKDGRVVYQKSFGYHTYENKLAVNNHTLYDLASITKIVSSTASLMYLKDIGKVSMDNTLGTYLRETNPTPYKNLNLREILTHQAGLSPWIPFYTKTLVNNRPDTLLYAKKPNGTKTAQVTPNLYLEESYEDSMIRQILKTPLRRSKSYRYSDLGYYFIKRVIEDKTEQKLEDFTSQHFYAPMGLPSLGYHPLEKFDISEITPTEEDRYFRYQKVQGTVHDMGAAMQNGVGGHAGLFSNATDLAGFMQMFLNEGEYGGKRYLSKSTVKTFTSCQFCPNNRRGMGFDKPVVSGNNGPTTPEASSESFGHTGFTGTIAWADPKYNVNYVFLSNRTYPDAENRKITTMNIRTDIQKVIYDIFK